ncbi:MAG: hypothetical protein IID33_04260 [Planctomycetes bacterium]|nr:hypothetical protein [Planctomycetota bacterium]
MTSSPLRRVHHGFGARTTGLALAILTVFAPYSGARQYIGQNGRLLDANTQIGGSGLNATRPVSPLLSGNAVATGNVGRGFSLRSVSPIASPYAFGTGLGSGALSAFRRDSVSVADSVFAYGGLTPRVYYDPSQTVFTPRYLGPQRTASPGFSPGGAGIGSRSVPVRPGISIGSQVTQLPGGPGLPQQPLDFRIDARIDRASGLRSQIVGLSPTDSAALNSTIFGTSPLLPRTPWPSSLLSAADSRRPQPSALLDSRAANSDPIGSALAEPLGTPLDLILRGADANTLLDRSARSMADGVSRLPGLQVYSQRPSAALPRAQTAAPASTPVSTPLGMPLVFGLDKFTDLQLAMSLSRDPNAVWFGEMKKVVSANPGFAIDMQSIMEMDSVQFADALMNMPIQTFVGRGNSALNESLMRAEALLRTRDYFDATRQYEQARMLDPGNPLPLIGKGHSSLGAGDYRTAVHNILLGLQRYPELTRMKVDLKAFMGGETIDIRRADLMHQLEQREDAKLRFLLGYLEYHSGRTQSGLAHLKKAALNAPAGSFIHQLPALMTGERVLPPPKLPLRPVLGPISRGRGSAANSAGTKEEP